MTTTTQPHPATTDFEHVAHRRRILRTIERKTFATLATTSPAGRAHSAGIVYVFVDGQLWVHTMAASRKAQNIAVNPHVGLCIVYRSLPVGPPFTIHFQATADIVAMDDPEVRALIDAGRLDSLTAHGALEMEGACFLRLRPGASAHSFGPGVRIIDLVRDPLNRGARSVLLEPALTPATEAD